MGISKIGQPFDIASHVGKRQLNGNQKDESPKKEKDLEHFCSKSLI